MKKSLVFVILAFAIFFLGFLSADISTTAVINTAPNYSILMRIYEIGGTQPITDSIYTASDGNGKSIVSFESPADEFEIEMWLKDPETGTYNLRHKRFEESFFAGVDFELDFYPSWYPIEQIEKARNSEPLSNQTEEVLNETTETANETVEENVSATETVTAHSISDSAFFRNKNVFYYIGGIIILAGLIILFFKYRKYRKLNPREPKKVKVVKLSEMKKDSDESSPKSGNDIKAQEEKIEAAKKMIQEAEDEIKKIKNPNRDKIEAAKKKLIEDQKELMRLREEAGE